MNPFHQKDWTAISMMHGLKHFGYTITKIMRGKKYLLALNGRAIGILPDPTELRRLAETDFLQRTQDNDLRI